MAFGSFINLCWPDVYKWCVPAPDFVRNLMNALLRYRLIANNLVQLRTITTIYRRSMQIRRPEAFAIFLSLWGISMICCAQKPGLQGMAPSKWITFRTTHAPGKVYRFANGGNKTFTNEEMYVRAWIPVIHKKNFALVLGPNYRAEQLEFKSSGENPAKKFEGWNLRTFALDLNSFIRLDSTSWLVLTSHINKTGNFAMLSAKEIPLNYTVSASYLKRKSPNKEIGAGVILNKSYKLTLLPVFLFNYNFSEKEGVEIMLPKKVAWRHNLSPNDLLYFKAEAVTRTYYLNRVAVGTPDVCRRIDVDMGISYNRRFGNFGGVEVFGGYRKNISNKMVHDAVPVRASGLAATVEFYIQPPSFRGKGRR